MTLPSINHTLPSGVPVTEEITEKDHQNIHLVINPEVLAILKKEEVTISELFVLVAMYHEKYALLDLYDEHSTKRPIIVLEYQRLLIHGFLQQPADDSTLIYELSEKGKAFVEVVSPYFELEEDEKEAEAKIKELTTSYLLLFPKIKLPSGVYGRVASTEIEKKLKAFYKTYRPVFKKDYGFKLTEEDILQATKAYVSRFEKTGYLYMANSSYFLQKKEKSALADEIIAMKNGLTESSVDKYTKQI